MFKRLHASVSFSPRATILAISSISWGVIFRHLPVLSIGFGADLHVFTLKNIRFDGRNVKSETLWRRNFALYPARFGDGIGTGMPTEPRFVTCPCQHCSGSIEFDASGLAQGETTNAECPHCQMETILFVLKQPVLIVENTPRTPLPIQAKAASLRWVNPTKQNANDGRTPGTIPLGIASMVFGLVGSVACWIPFLEPFAIPSALIGLALALAGIVMAGIYQKKDFTYSISGGIICALSVCIALIATGAFATWSKSLVVQRGDLRIEVELTSPVFIPNVASDPSKGANYLDGAFTIKLSNLSNSKKIDFKTWRGKAFGVGKNYATLTDNSGNVYKLQEVDFNRNGKPDEFSIYPEQSCWDWLLFERPVSNFKWLHLELPAGNFGGSGVVRFEIPEDAQQ